MSTVATEEQSEWEGATPAGDGKIEFAPSGKHSQQKKMVKRDPREREPENLWGDGCCVVVHDGVVKYEMWKQLKGQTWGEKYGLDKKKRGGRGGRARKGQA